MWKIREFINSDKYNHPLFFGYNTKENIIKHLNTLPRDKRTWTFSWTHRIYWKCPIKDAFNMPSLLALINNEEQTQELPIPEVKITPLIVDNVDKSERYITYLPLYTIRAACGYFGDGEEVSERGWIKVEGAGRLNHNMFIVQAVGHSMEPRIHDGDYCVFQANPAGTRQDKIVLAQHRGYFDDDNAGSYSIKKYHSTKITNEYGEWEHESIELRPLNPDYEPIILTPDDIDSFRIVGEFITTL